MTRKRSTSNPRRHARWFLAVAGIALVFGGAALALGAGNGSHEPAHAALGASYQSVTAAPQPTPSATTATPAPQPAAKPSGRLTIAAAGLDAPLRRMVVPANGTLDPATWWDAYWVDGYGTPGDAGSGTVFVAMHSGRGSTQALGNAIVNRGTGKPALKPGAEIIADGVKFSVTGGRVAEKGSLHYETDLWDGSHDLIIVTCQQFADGRPSKNSLTFAKRT